MKKITNERREAIRDLLRTMESFLLKSKWFAGDEVTIADFSYLANVATIKVIPNSNTLQLPETKILFEPVNE